jgi:hypothetical protein
MIKRRIKQINWVLVSLVSLAVLVFVREKLELSKYDGELIGSVSATVPPEAVPIIPSGDGDDGDGGEF